MRSNEKANDAVINERTIGKLDNVPTTTTLGDGQSAPRFSKEYPNDDVLLGSVK